MGSKWHKQFVCPYSNNGSVALLWQNTKCKCKFANKRAEADAHPSKWLSLGFTLHFTFCQSKATDPTSTVKHKRMIMGITTLLLLFFCFSIQKFTKILFFHFVFFIYSGRYTRSIHITYRYIDLLSWFFHESCLGRPLAARPAQTTLRGKSWKETIFKIMAGRINVSICNVDPSYDLYSLMVILVTGWYGLH